MFIAIFFSALLLMGLLFWCKKNFFNPSGSANRTSPFYQIVLMIIVCFAFVGTQYMIDFALMNNPEKSTHLISSKVNPSGFLSPDEQYEIAKAFYLGEGLPKDDAQALQWLTMAAMQGNQPAKELIAILGNERKPTSSFAVDILQADKVKTTLKDIAGMNQAKEDVQQFLDFLKNKDKFKHLGAKIPKGILLYGPPGTGKTLLARAIAGEAHATFISVSGAAFEEELLGRGAARVRELFTLAREHKPAIIFIDEIDALAPSRQQNNTQSGQIQTINQLLSEMDNIDSDKNADITILAATNRMEVLDPALLRPGRFDWQINIPLPSENDRKEILSKLLKQIAASSNININQLVENTAGFSGALLNNLVNEAAIIAGKNNKSQVDNESFQLALKKISTYNREPSANFAINILSASEIKTKISDIAGMNEVKSEIADVIDYLKNPEKFTRLGAKPPSGILLYGPPGTGKTMMARAIAGEAHTAFLTIAGSAFDEKLVGVGASRVRDLFATARKYKPCIVFIDEMDALVPKRSSEEMAGRDQTINQFLNEMDNIQKNVNEGIVFIGATNRIDIMDPAILRPGRFDRKIYFRLPQLLERKEILNVLLKNIHSKDIKVKVLAEITSGYSGADLENLVNEAAIDATKKNKSFVDMASFEEANDKISLGVNQGSGSYSEKEKKLTAYHEAGHALVALLHPFHIRKLHKMTIGLRNESLGVTHFRLETDMSSLNKKELEAIISTSLGGYVAEELIFGKDNVTTGAASDLVNANQLAKDMVTKYAMADNQSLIIYDVLPESEDKVINNAQIILNRDYLEAKTILEKNIDKLHLLADTLLKQETLDYDKIVKLLKIKTS